MSVSLAERMATAYDSDDDEERSNYRIGDKGSPYGEADWAARKALWARRKIADLRVEADRQIAQAEAWFAEEAAGYQDDVDRFEGLLRMWWQGEMGQQLEDFGGWGKIPAKSQKLPCGAVVEASKTPDAMTVLDEDKFLAWLLRARSDLVEWKPKTKIGEAKKVLVAGPREADELDPWASRAEVRNPSTGEVVPGVEFTSRINFSVTLP